MKFAGDIHGLQRINVTDPKMHVASKIHVYVKETSEYHQQKVKKKT